MNIRRARRSRRISTAIFARNLGIARARLDDLESGKCEWPPALRILAIKLLTRREQWPD